MAFGEIIAIIGVGISLFVYIHSRTKEITDRQCRMEQDIGSLRERLAILETAYRLKYAEIGRNLLNSDESLTKAIEERK